MEPGPAASNAFLCNSQCKICKSVESLPTCTRRPYNMELGPPALGGPLQDFSHPAHTIATPPATYYVRVRACVCGCDCAAVGCADPGDQLLPPGARLVRSEQDKHVALVRCLSSRQSWQVTCRHGAWSLDNVGNCTATTPPHVEGRPTILFATSPSESGSLICIYSAVLSKASRAPAAVDSADVVRPRNKLWAPEWLIVYI